MSIRGACQDCRQETRRKCSMLAKGYPIYKGNSNLISTLWILLEVEALCLNSSVSSSAADFCQFGTRWKKVTKFMMRYEPDE
eukprot:7434069-Pyramimonas_sp.AAC.1